MGRMDIVTLDFGGVALCGCTGLPGGIPSTTRETFALSLWLGPFSVSNLFPAGTGGLGPATTGRIGTGVVTFGLKGSYASATINLNPNTQKEEKDVVLRRGEGK